MLLLKEWHHLHFIHFKNQSLQIHFRYSDFDIITKKFSKVIMAFRYDNQYIQNGEVCVPNFCAISKTCIVLQQFPPVGCVGVLSRLVEIFVLRLIIIFIRLYLSTGASRSACEIFCLLSLAINFII